MEKQTAPKTPLSKRLRYHFFLRFFFCILSALPAVWASAAIYFSNLPGSFLRTVCSVSFFIFALSIAFWAKTLKRGIKIFFISFLLVLTWWWLIPASNHRDWQTDVAVLPYADIDGNTITLHNIRNFDYISIEDYTPAYYDKTVQLGQLQTADLFLIYWGPTLIAHTIISFGFEDGRYVAISIETRKEEGEGYSAIKGFFKQFELTYVVADERDVVRLRTNYRKEDVYLYRLQLEPEFIQEVFLDYFKTINRLVEEPKWYNALTHNCTTTIRGHSKPYNPNSKFDWRMLANGLIDQMGYERGSIDNTLPFEELKKKSLINERAKTADQDMDFSQRIRESTPTSNFSPEPSL
ncbi:MAG: Lnb N-terminal periplasmic domain-containing protein [Planctomycetota bacterium]|jgi:hypothetical protein